MAKTGEFKCGKCGRTFSMAAHLARHTSTMHVRGAKKKVKKRKKKGAGGWPKGKKRKKSRKGIPLGPRSVAGVKLGSLSLDQLGQLIDAARATAHKKIAELQRSLG